MATKKNSVVVGVFKDRNQAEQAVDALQKAGFKDSQIGVVARDGKPVRGIKNRSTLAEEGAVGGAAVGLGAGMLAGLGVIAGVIPAIGPAIAGGILGSILSSAGLGAAAGGLIGALVGLGIPEEDAEFYEKEFKAGRIIVTVKNAARADEAMEILKRYEGYNAAMMRDVKPAARVSKSTGDKHIEVREEQLEATKRPVRKGEVRVRKEVVTEHKTIDVPVTREEVVVERRQVRGRRASAVGLEGNQDIRIPVQEEEVIVNKRPVVKEEVTIGKRQIQENKRVGGSVRREQVKVEESANVKVRRRNGNDE